MLEWFIYIEDEGDWPISGTHKTKAEARNAYLKWAGRQRIPAGSIMVVSITNVHKNPEFWENPLMFDPDRFLPENSKQRPKFAYLPFGSGPRLCIGNYFALIEGPLVLASIYQKYGLKLDSDHKVIVDALVTLRPQNGLPMQVMTT